VNERGPLVRLHRTLPLFAVGMSVALLLQGCSPLDETPVPDAQPEGPTACDGVARQSVEAIVGRPAKSYQFGDWRTIRETGFSCEVDSPHGAIDIRVTPLSREDKGAEAAERVTEWRDAGGDPIETDLAPGEGYLFGEPGQVITAAWVCTDRSLEVVLQDVWIDDRRDQRQDAQNLLFSLLPYTCAQQQVPGVDYTEPEK